MYFVIVLLLLFETEFTCSMMRHGTQQMEGNEMVPLEIAYTNSVKKFILHVVHPASHYLSNVPLILFKLIGKNKGRELYDKCGDIEPNPSEPGKFRATQSSLRSCQLGCAKLNLQYVRYLEECISLAKEKIFENEASFYEVELIPIQRDIGTCIEKELKVFLCHCTTNYRIRVSQSLKNAVETAVSMPNGFSLIRDMNRNFFAFIIMLKYHPRAAPLFFAYLIHHFKISVAEAKIPEISECDLEYNLILNTEVSTAALPEGGLIDNQGSILRNEDKIFQRLLQEIYCRECDLEIFGYRYVNPMFAIYFLVILNALIYNLYQLIKN